MPKEYARSTRVAEQLRRELGEMIRYGVKDPRAEGASVTDVEVSKDLSYAKVYFSRLEDDAERIQETKAALTRAAGFLRRELGKTLRLRHVPELRFEYDRSIAEGMRMDALIAKAREKDDKASGGDDS
ncbi:MAG: 30S ribosome-binding factor RbfA [Gammaproteobacteria bacterium]|nr:30S ribosome-binding factor RbfA [Gammaproteobacteria bacterium]